ncbi:MAG: NUDIX domain-containing protein [Bacteroidia bacterium]|nr:NUDIX domain-containing protein [Bacteroidia bacterium]
MNIKLYFNAIFLELSNQNPAATADSNSLMFVVEKGNQHSVKEIVDNFLNKNESKNFRIFCTDGEWLYKKVKKQFVYIEAAGGFIEKLGETLFIFRNNLWDLPKGKLEKNELVEDAAIRECEEECGINQLTITRSLNPSYHIYNYKGNYALKKTYWYYMQTTYNKTLKPQLEENITEVKWFTKEEIEQQILPNTYITIREVIADAFTN